MLKCSFPRIRHYDKCYDPCIIHSIMWPLHCLPELGNLHSYKHKNVWNILEYHIQHVSSSGTACIIKKRIVKKTLRLYLIQIWCKCKCYRVGRGESNSSQFRCCRLFSVIKIGFLVDMIQLAAKSRDRVTVMQMIMVKKTCPVSKICIYPHDNWYIFKLYAWPVLSVSDMDPLQWMWYPVVIVLSCISISFKKYASMLWHQLSITFW